MEEKLNKTKSVVINFLKQPLLYVIILCIFVQVKIYNTVPNYVMTSDSYTYYEEYTENILQGQVSKLRTPVYPYFIRAIAKIGGQDNLYNNVAITQKLLFVVTLILFYYCIKRITKNNLITSVLTIIFGVCPFILLWNIMILTEAVSIFEIVLLSFITISYLQKPSKASAIAIGLLTFIMIMTRPSFIYILPIYLLFWVLRLLFNKKEKKAITGIISCLACGVLLLGYSGLMKSQHGVFSVTAVSYINNAVTAINSNSYKYSDNKEMAKLVEDIKGERIDGDICWTAFRELENSYSSEEIQSFAKSALKNDKEYFKFIVQKTVELGTLNIGTSGYIPNDVFINGKYANQVYSYIGNLILPINFAVLYMGIIISVIYLLYDMLKNAKIDWYIAFFTVLIAANIFTLVVGAPFESQRLFASSIPLVLLAIGYVLAKGTSKNKDNTEKIDEENNLFYKLFLEKTSDGKIQFFRYLFVGGFAAVVNIGALYVLKEAFGLYYLVANVLSFILGLATNYALSKWLVFAKEDSINGIAEFVIYVLIGVLGLGFDTLLMWIFTDKIGVYFMLSKIISTLLVFIWNFLARKGMYIIANKLRKDK